MMEFTRRSTAEINKPAEQVRPNDGRNRIRKESAISPYLRSSLQPCSDPNLLLRKLSSLEEIHKKSRQYVDKVIGLQRVLMELMIPGTNGSGYRGIISVKEAHELYDSYHSRPTDEVIFRDILLHQTYGLCVHIASFPNMTTRLVILKSQNLDLCQLLEYISHDLEAKKLDGRTDNISRNYVQMVLKSMNSEWDRTCARMLFAAGKTRAVIDSCGIKSDVISSQRDRFTEICQEIDNTSIAAHDLVKMQLDEKKNKLAQETRSVEQLIEKQQHIWSEVRLEELNEKKAILQDRLDSVNKLQDQTERKDQQRYRQMLKRTAQKLTEDHRLKRRRLGAGAPTKVDSEDEEFIAKAIEDKATYHGRRHNTVMYTNRRVKVRDLMNIANHSLKLRGKKTIKSSTTAWNRSKARHVRSRQAQLHIGKGLFCTKKPPKAEDKYNVNTHHQRAHINNVKMALFATVEDSKYGYIHSMDDKAFVRPGTSEGFEKSRNVRILTISGPTARQLPKYDWPERLVYQTPAAHRIMLKEIKNVDNKPTLYTTSDRHFVIVRPKAFVDSSGSTWASEKVRLRYEEPDTFEVPENGQRVSAKLRCYCAMVRDALFHFKDMTVKEDYERVTYNPSCPYMEYEQERADNIIQKLEDCETYKELNELDSEVDTEVLNMLNTVMTLNDKFIELKNDMNHRTVTNVSFSNISDKCEEVISTIKNLNLPMVKPRRADLTDAGPGVGVNNIQVQFRDAEMNRMYNSDYSIRVHRSRDDSGQGEAERTNSASGDAIVDGGTIHWEKFKQFEGMNDQEISTLSLPEYEELESKRMEKNAWDITNQLVERLDDAPVLSEFIRSMPSQKPEKLFFFNQKRLKKFTDASANTKKTMPGAGYFSKIFDFIESHYLMGELYMEYRKGSCEEKSGTMCSYCSGSGWQGPQMERIARPWPDYDQLPSYHYKHVGDTPSQDVEGNKRLPDDFQPRSNLKRMFQEGTVSLDDDENIQTFCEKFIVHEKLVKEHLEHMLNLKRKSEMRTVDRQREKAAKQNKEFHEYNWDRLVEQGDIGKLTVQELTKYLNHHNLSTRGNKKDKVRRLVAHFYMQLETEMPEREIEYASEDEEGGEDAGEDDYDMYSLASDSEDDDVVEEEVEEGEIDLCDNELEDTIPTITQTRSGRLSKRRQNTDYIY